MLLRMRIAVCLVALCVLPLAGQSKGDPLVPPPATFKGVIKAVEGGKIELEMPDGNLMEFRVTRKSKFQVSGKAAKLKDLSSGQTAEIDGRYVLGTVEAIKIVAKSPPQPESRP